MKHSGIGSSVIMNKVKQNQHFFLLEEKGKNKKDRGSEIEWGGESSESFEKMRNQNVFR